ncbi:MAG: hypothetical protein HN849_33735 [Victivallales bacterium]|jgi:hypothetical protein|nr:hypothetical protein [Victivallales bacterium]
MLAKHVIVGVHITDRVTNAALVQEVCTSYGCAIRTRLGLHDTGEEFCSPNGLLLLEFVGGDDRLAALEAQLGGIDGLEVQTMVFDHP